MARIHTHRIDGGHGHYFGSPRHCGTDLQKSIIRAKESVLRSNLFTIRNMIDEYTVDKQKAPEVLQELVSDGYLRQIPQDPMTGSEQTWRIIMEDTPVGGSNSSPGIFDVRSGSEKTGLDGTHYSDW